MNQPDKPDFDPTHLLDGWKPADAAASRPALDLDHLLDGLRPEPASEALADPLRLARLKKRGFAMDDVEDVEVPEIRLPPVEAPPPLDEIGLGRALRAASALSRPAAPELDARLRSGWEPGCAIGVARLALAASTELIQTADGPLLDSHPPQWLVAAWPPQGPGTPPLGRWPEQALLVTAQDRSSAAQALLPGLPAEGPLWLAELDVDWALIAELVLHHDASLKPFQLKALRALGEAEKLSTFERLNRDYEPATAERAMRRRAAPSAR
ncbi:hypothetical protein BH11PSE10_BH11PSE10_16610 [soil metagenome]